MVSFQIHRFCCCGLRSGCLAIAIINMVLGILGLVNGIYLMSVNGVSKNSLTTIIVGAVVFAAAICLQQGIAKRNPRLMRVWSIVTIIRLFTEVFALIICIILVFAPDAMNSTASTWEDRELLNRLSSYSWLYVICLTIDILFDLYCLAAVHSYSLQIRAETSGPVPPVGYAAPVGYPTPVVYVAHGGYEAPPNYEYVIKDDKHIV